MPARPAFPAEPATEYNGLTLQPDRYRLVAGSPAQLHDDGIIDPIAVERRLDGRPARLTPREVVCVIYDGARRHLTDWRLAEILNTTPDAVQKIRARHNIATVPALRSAGTRSNQAIDHLPRTARGFRRFPMSQPMPLVYSPTFGSGDMRHRRRRSAVMSAA